jgi:hypothetical protein
MRFAIEEARYRGYAVTAVDIVTWDDAWLRGDRDALAATYGGLGLTPVVAGPAGHPAPFRGGVLGTVARWFWGQPSRAGQRSTKLHMPAAAIAATRAVLLTKLVPEGRLIRERRGPRPGASADRSLS